MLALNITFRNLEPSDNIRDRAEKKFRKVAKHLREPVDAHLVLKVEKHRHSAEITVSGGSDQHFTAHEVSSDTYATIDALMTKLERSVRRAKERVIDRSQAGSGESVDGFAAP